MINVLVATKNLSVFDPLKKRDPVNIHTALYTGEVAARLGQATLVIVDWDDLTAYPYSITYVHEALIRRQSEGTTIFVTAAEFLDDPDGWLTQAQTMSPANGREPLPQRVIAFTSISGGVGLTSLALDTAHTFARHAQTAVALVEFTVGASALALNTNRDAPPLWDLINTPDLAPARWNGVDLYPMNYDHCQLLPEDQVGDYLKSRFANYNLIVIDAGHWPHPLMGPIVQELVDRWLVVAVPRPDAIENARILADRLGHKASLILNQMGSLADQVAVLGFDHALKLPRLERVERYDGRLGHKILTHIYGRRWTYEPRSRLASLWPGRAFGRSVHRSGIVPAS